MNRINNTNGRAASRAQLAHGLVNNEGKWLLPSSRGVQRRISRRVKPLASWIVYYALFFSLCVSASAGLLKADVNFSNYDTPLFQHIVNRIKDKVAARLGEVVNTKDRYFIVPFAFQKRGNNPQFAHSFISVIRVLGDGNSPASLRDSGEGDSRTGILKHLPSAGCLTILVLIRCAFSMASAAAFLRHGTNVLSWSGETSGWMRR